jgi:hypothetical protein
MHSRFLSLLLMIVVSAGASAQTIGNYILAPNATTSGLSIPYTVLDLSSPATSNGTIAAVAVRGTTACTNAFKVKFFHVTGNVYTPYAERGPFDITFPITVVQFPGVAVTAGDLMGIVTLADCGVILGQLPLLFKNAAQFNGDVSGQVSLQNSAGVIPGFAIGAFGAPNANVEIRTQIIPAAATTQGAGGSFFKTDLFLSNYRTTRSVGRLIYHPEETSGTVNDPAFPFILESHASTVLTNFVGDKLGKTGKGSIDVYTRMGFEAPTIATRIYDDAGAAGTKGFTLDAMTEREALQASEVAVLAVPSDASKYRMNIGWRTLEGATTIEFNLYDANGAPRTAITRNLAGNYYQQTDFHSLFGVDFQPGDTIHVVQRAGQAFVYGSIIDNASNDPSVQVAKTVK